MPTATIPAGQDHVDKAHGLGYAPDADQIIVTPQDDLGARTCSVPPANINATTFRITISSIDLETDHSFTYKILAPTITGLGSVTPDRVRDRVKLTSSDIDDLKVTELILDAEATIETETGLSIDYTNCTQAEAAAITNLAAIYCLVYVSGGVASGLSYTIGSLSVSESKGGASLSGKAETLYREIERLVEQLRAPYLGMV